MLVSSQDVEAKIVSKKFVIMPCGHATICELKMQNGFLAYGLSACVDPAEFKPDLGEKYAFEKAFSKAWEYEGYLMAQRRFEGGGSIADEVSELDKEWQNAEPGDLDLNGDDDLRFEEDEEDEEEDPEDHQ